jgi:hypothetical protein
MRPLIRATGHAYALAACVLAGYLAGQRARRLDAARFARALEQWLDTGVDGADLGTDD